MAYLYFYAWLTLLTWFCVHGYIPAEPTNSTQSAIDAGLNISDISQIQLQWFPNGFYGQNVSYQLVGNNSNGISKGALVHFSEDVAGPNISTSTPWIALISCDSNGTSFSLIDDIFTLARDRGAVSALLYSLYSSACIINPEYASPAKFDQVFDIFSTQSLPSAHLIEYQFGQFGALPNQTLQGVYNYTRLTQISADVNASISKGQLVSSGYLIATLRAYNATGIAPPNVPGGDPLPSQNPNQGTSNTGLAMIILYAITGCVSALFIVVIITGAIRAVRHPERYGPRLGPDGGLNGGQSRARGLTRAILDTFPIVKFGGDGVDSDARPPKDVEGTEMAATDAVATPGDALRVDQQEESGSPPPRSPQRAEGSHSGAAGPLMVDESPPSYPGSVEGASPQQHRRAASKQAATGSDDVVPSAIGRETCPICIVDFEEGDDLRVLPCEGKHRFHQQCVDPWLLELSSSCPICRQDFLALETMLSGGGDEVPTRASHYQSQNRFSRYLRFARGRREREDPTDPYMHTAPSTSM